MVRKTLIFILSSLIYLPSSAQLDNRFLSDRIDVNESDSNTVGLSVNAFSYLRNTEYFNDIELGRTLFGYTLNPSVYIQPNKKVRLQTGVFVRNDFGGNNPYTFAAPTFTLKIGRPGRTQVIFGTLEGALSHNLIEQLFDINSAIERRIENGFQVKRETGAGFTDVWINWEQFIERGSPFKEQFTAGFNLNRKIISRSVPTEQERVRIESFYVAPEIQGLIHHRGGQIDTDTSNMVMQANIAGGLVIYKLFTGFIESLRADAYAVFYRETTNSGYFPYRNGSGVLTDLTVNTKWINLMLTYWEGSSFMAPRGTRLYQSVSLDKPGLTESRRQLFFVRLMYQKRLYENLYLVARAEPVYDLKNSILDYSYSLYLTYRQDIRLGKLKR